MRYLASRIQVNKIIAITGACLALLFPVFVYAGASADIVAPSCSTNQIQNYLQEGVNMATGQQGCDQGAGDLSTGVSIIAQKVVNIFSVIVGVVAVLMVIYGGFRYIISGGDSSRVGTAKNTLIYAIIGLVIVALAQLIVHYVLNTASSVSAGSVGVVTSLIR
jgi:uncharacterized membrane protein